MNLRFFLQANDTTNKEAKQEIEALALKLNSIEVDKIIQMLENMK